MSNLELYALVVGFFLPPALALLQQKSWSAPLKSVVAFLAALVAGAGTAYFQGDLTGRRFVEAALVVLVAGIATYHGLWRPTTIAPVIEEKTSF